MNYKKMVKDYLDDRFYAESVREEEAARLTSDLLKWMGFKDTSETNPHYKKYFETHMKHFMDGPYMASCERAKDLRYPFTIRLYWKIYDFFYQWITFPRLRISRIIQRSKEVMF